MVKVSFLGILSFFERAAVARLDEVLHEICDKEDSVEFWFYGCNKPLDKQALPIILDIQAEMPDKSIQIVDLVDVLKAERLDIKIDDQLRIDGFPANIGVRIEYAPRLEGKNENHEERFMIRHNKISKWLREQCDYVIVYNYDNVPDSVNSFVNRTKALPKTTVISIALPSTAQRLDELIEELDGRKKDIVKGLNEGKTYQEVGDMFGISYKRVQQIATRAGRELYWNFRRNPHK